MADELGRVLVTGANGNLGRRLLRRLAGEPGASARAAVRSERAAALLRGLPEDVRPEIEILDYGDAEQLARAARGCRSAVHLVGIVRETAANRYVAAHEGTSRALARAAADSGLRRIVYLSILGAAAASPNPCLASKGRAERILLEAVTPTLILRLPMVLGPEDVASRALRAQALARVLPLVRGGATREQPIDSDDVVEAIVRGLARADLDDVALELAGPESLSHRELVERAARLLGRTPFVLPVPLALVRATASVAERLFANPPLSRALLGVLEHDDAIDVAPACRRLGLELTPLEQTLRRCVAGETAP